MVDTRTCQYGEIPDKEASKGAQSEEDVVMFPACPAVGTEEIDGAFFCKEHYAPAKVVYDELMAEMEAEFALFMKALSGGLGGEEDPMLAELKALLGDDVEIIELPF